MCFVNNVHSLMFQLIQIKRLFSITAHNTIYSRHVKRPRKHCCEFLLDKLQQVWKDGRVKEVVVQRVWKACLSSQGTNNLSYYFIFLERGMKLLLLLL